MKRAEGNRTCEREGKIKKYIYLAEVPEIVAFKKEIQERKGGWKRGLVTQILCVCVCV